MNKWALKNCIYKLCVCASIEQIHLLISSSICFCDFQFLETCLQTYYCISILKSNTVKDFSKQIADHSFIYIILILFKTEIKKINNLSQNYEIALQLTTTRHTIVILQLKSL